MKKLQLLLALFIFSIYANSQNGLAPNQQAAQDEAQPCDAFNLSQWDGADYLFDGSMSNGQAGLKFWKSNNEQPSLSDILKLAPYFTDNLPIENAQADNSIYWLQLPLCNSEQAARTYLFDLDPMNYRWERIEAHLVHADGSIISQVTGSHLAKAEKPIYSEKHLLEFKVEAKEQVWLFVKLQKPLAKALTANRPLHLKVALIDAKNHPGYFQGYPFTGHFESIETDFPFNGNAIVNHEWYIDESSEANIDDVVQSWHQLNKGDLYNTSHEVNKVYWMKAQFYGSEAFKGDHILHIAPEVGMDNFSFDYMDAYLINQRGERTHQRLGDQVATRNRPYNFWANFIKLNLSAKDTVDLYVRLEGSTKYHLMPKMGLFHIDAATVFPHQTNEALKNGVFYGILIIQIVFFFLLFLIEKDKIHLYFTLMGLGILCGVGFNNISFKSYEPFPFLRNYQIPLYAIGVFLSQFGFLLFTRTYFNYTKDSFFRKRFLPVFTTIFALITLLVIIQFEYVDVNGIPYNKKGYYLAFVFITLVSLITGFTMGVKAPKQHSISKKYFFAAFTPLIFTVISFIVIQLTVILQVEEWINLQWYYSSWEITKFAVVSLLMLLALSIGNRTNRLKAEKASALKKNLEDQKRINQAISKFVPNEFLSALGKTNITEVNLGDHIEKEVTVLFSDMRNFTGLSEQMSPEANFKFVYEFSSHMGPIIQRHHGFINQFLGDGIMAIFPNSPDDALQAAIEMQQVLRGFNQQQKDKKEPIVQIGIGMHTGPLVMGIIGDDNRMDAATISDSVNTASRIEALTKHYGSGILISETSLKLLKDPMLYNHRHLGAAALKGKKEPLNIYECVDGDSPRIKGKKIASIYKFKKALNLYFQKDFTRAALLMEEILKHNPHDETANLFLHQAKENEMNGVVEDWTGVAEYAGK